MRGVMLGLKFPWQLLHLLCDGVQLIYTLLKSYSTIIQILIASSQVFNDLLDLGEGFVQEITLTNEIHHPSILMSDPL